jgi:hypothetical protein
MTKFYDTVAKTEYDGLIASASPTASVFGVLIRAGEGEIKRGTILAFSDADEKYVILGTDPDGAETLTPSAVLAEDAAVDENADTSAIAYRSGHFVRGSLLTRDAAITKSVEENLRMHGILLSDAIE